MKSKITNFIQKTNIFQKVETPSVEIPVVETTIQKQHILSPTEQLVKLNIEHQERRALENQREKIPDRLDVNFRKFFEKRFTYTLYSLEALYYICSYLRICSQKLKTETFRGGIDYHLKFKYKCPVCDEICEELPKDKCNCGAEIIESENTRPNISEIPILKKWIDKVNKSPNYDLIKLSKQVSEKWVQFDECYVLAQKDYIINRFTGLIEDHEIKAFWVLDNKVMKRVRDKQDMPGGRWWACPNMEHRIDPYVKEEPGYCECCNAKLYEVFYYSTYDEWDEKPLKYYLEPEIYYDTYYSDQQWGGFPIIVSLWSSIRSLLSLNRLKLDYYVNQKNPSKLTFIRSQNFDNTEKTINSIREISKEDRLFSHVIPVNASSNLKLDDIIKTVDLLPDIANILQNELAEGFIREIALYLGVSPIFLNDTSTGGGLNNEGLQVTVTNRGTEYSQYKHDKLYCWVTKQIKVYDYEIKLNPSEEKDEMAEQQRKNLELQNAMIQSALGFNIELDEFGFPKVDGKKDPNELLQERINDMGTQFPGIEPRKPSVRQNPQLVGRTGDLRASDQPLQTTTPNAFNYVYNQKKPSFLPSKKKTILIK
jgi:hypothetical protein